jgi:hypothetical protein
LERAVDIPISNAAFLYGGVLERTACRNGRPGFAYQSNCRRHRSRYGCGPLTVRDRCVKPDIDTAIGMAEDSIAAPRPRWTVAPILFR